MPSPRLDKRRLRAIEDALIRREAMPGDLHTLPEADYEDALAWVADQLGRRRLKPVERERAWTPLEAWLRQHPEP
jgi:hypothetical protein